MAEMTNRAWVGDALELLAKGLKPFVKTHMSKTSPRGANWLQEFVRAGRRTPSLDDPSFLLEVLDRGWRRMGGQFPDATRNSIKLLVSALREERNVWAHYDAIDGHDAAHAISGIVKLLRAVDAVEADEAQHLLDNFNRAQSVGGAGMAPSALGARPAASRRSPTPTVDQILDCLNRERIRATYGAVGEVFGATCSKRWRSAREPHQAGFVGRELPDWQAHRL